MSDSTNGDMPTFRTLAMPNWRRAILVIYLLLLFIVMTYVMYEIWPVKTVDPETGQAGYRSVVIIQRAFNKGLELRMFLLVILAGALGECVHVAISFITYAGNRAMRASCFWWYPFRPFIGWLMNPIYRGIPGREGAGSAI